MIFRITLSRILTVLNVALLSILLAPATAGACGEVNYQNAPSPIGGPCDPTLTTSAGATVAAMIAAGVAAPVITAFIRAAVAQGANLNSLVNALGAAQTAVVSRLPFTPGRPPWLQGRMAMGNEFNRQRYPLYPHNEVTINNVYMPNLPAGTRFRIDSYIPNVEIVERKYTQFANIQPRSGIQYLRDLANRYQPGQIIANTPANIAQRPGLVGLPIRGAQVLEVPVQNGPIPQDVLGEAYNLDIIIRDITGQEYTL